MFHRNYNCLHSYPHSHSLFFCHSLRHLSHWTICWRTNCLMSVFSVSSLSEPLQFFFYLLHWAKYFAPSFVFKIIVCINSDNRITYFKCPRKILIQFLCIWDFLYFFIYIYMALLKKRFGLWLDLQSEIVFFWKSHRVRAGSIYRIPEWYWDATS